MGQSTPIVRRMYPMPIPIHDTAAEYDYNMAIAKGANTCDKALRELVLAHIVAYPSGINPNHAR